MTQEITVAILGAGPVGLEAALALRQRGYDVQVYERGRVGESLRQWAHVTMFSPWSLNVSALGLAALAEQGLAAPPPEASPTGAEYLARYLEPLAADPRLAGRVHAHTRVVQVGREGVLKGERIGSATRRERPFRLLLEGPGGDERVAYAQVVLDATGTWAQPNALGDGGILAPGERKARARGLIQHDIPAPGSSALEALAGRRVAVVGAGYSAITTLHILMDFARQRPGTELVWLTRQEGAPYARIENDTLPQRDALAALGNALAAGERPDGVTWRGGVEIDAVELDEDGVGALVLRGGARVEGLARVYANVGYQPDLSLHRELQVHQCYASEGPMKLAAALLAAGGGGGDCLAQASPGAETLKSPEPDFYILGAKSYGRGSAFLLKLGLEQIEDIVGLLPR
jgi:hypothetical protein